MSEQAKYLHVAQNLVERKRVLWDEEKEKLKNKIAEAVKEHTSLPNNYWHDERRAYNEYIAAENYLAAVKEVEGYD